MNKYQEAIKSLLHGIDYMIQNAMTKSTQIYNGLIVSKTGNKAEIRVNGKTFTLPQYGNFSHVVNETVKVFVPQGNMNLAFYI